MACGAPPEPQAGQPALGAPSGMKVVGGAESYGAEMPPVGVHARSRHERPGSHYALLEGWGQWGLGQGVREWGRRRGGLRHG